MGSTVANEVESNDQIAPTKDLSPAVRAIKQLGQEWNSTFVPRKMIPEFTNNLYSAGYLANLDAKGTGVPFAFRIGKQVCYPVPELIEWLIEKVEPINDN